MSRMPRKTIAGIEELSQRQYKNAETVICEFMAIQEYDVDEGDPPQYKDFNLQQFHDYIAKRIEVLDARFNLYNGKRGPYQTKKE